MVWRYVKVVGTIAHAEKSLGDVRIDIDVPISRARKIFTGDVEPEKLRGHTVHLYIPQIKTEKRSK